MKKYEEKGIKRLIGKPGLLLGQRRFMLSMAMMCLLCNLQAQLDISRQNTDPQMPTEQTYWFMKYGKVGASLYTPTLGVGSAYVGLKASVYACETTNYCKIKKRIIE